jgi:hypothetical protein
MQLLKQRGEKMREERKVEVVNKLTQDQIREAKISDIEEMIAKHDEQMIEIRQEMIKLRKDIAEISKKLTKINKKEK